MVASHAPVAQAWSAPSPSSQSSARTSTANDRRVARAASQHVWGSLTGASFPRGSQRPFSSGVAKTRSTNNRVAGRMPKNAPIGTQDVVLYFGLYVLPVLY